jgi:cysteine desulfurase
MIYLDHNASTYVLPHIYRELEQLALIGNPDSQHAAGRISSEIIYSCKNAIANLLLLKAGNILFTSSATEANAIAIQSYIAKGFTIFASAVEHKSVISYAHHIIPVDTSGRIRYEDLFEKIRAHKDPTKIVLACMYANNETGVILDPDESLVRISQQSGIKLHIDASQCYLKGGFLSESQKKCASSIVLSGHKMHALKGVGALAFKDDIFPLLVPIMRGGSQQWGLRPGTQNTEAIYSMLRAVEEIDRYTTDDYATMSSMIAEIEHSLKDIAEINGSISGRLCNTTNLYFPSIQDSAAFTDLLSEHGVMVSGMSACDSGINTRSYVLEAMFGDMSDVSHSSIRISIAKNTKMSDVKGACAIIKKLASAV